MDIIDFFGTYPNINDGFQYELFKNKEFYQLKNTEQIDNENYNHQIFVQRFLSNNTPYNSLLLFHGLGSGKTRSSILVNEINRNLYSKQAMIFVKSEILMNNYRDQLSQYSDKYKPKNDTGDIIPDSKKNTDEYKRKLKKVVKVDYSFFTFQKFASDIQKLSNEEITSRFSNKIIIIDEAHNLRIQQNKKEVTSKTYNSFHRFLHNINHCKILLLSATPIWDSTDEIASLMNLILPMDKQLDYNKFDEKFFKKNYLINKNDLLKKFNGQISYLRQTQSDVVKDYQGTVMSNMYGNKLVLNEISKEHYDLLQKLREQKKKDAARHSELEAASFLYQKSNGDYVYGKDLIGVVFKENNNKWDFISNTIKSDIQNNLHKYSPKFYDTIQQILNNPNELVFVYHHFVKNSGTILFGLVLELFGFQKTNGNIDFNKIFSKKLRYATITGETSDKEAQQILLRFNDPRNKHGEYIQVLIGSKKISEGVTLKNVQQMHIITPYWNFSSMDQAIGRTIRINSHNDLIRPNYTPSVKIFIHAISYKNKQTIDIEAFNIAVDKDYKTRQIYRVLKEIAVDCPINYKHNVKPYDLSKSRDCDYYECNYKCAHISPSGHDENEIYNYTLDINEIYNTNYNLFYSEKEINNIILFLKYLFKFNYKLSLQQINQTINKDEQLILHSLNHLIYNKIIIRDKYGFPYYLNEINNLYFLYSSNTNIYQPIYYIIQQPKDLKTIITNIKSEDEFKDILKRCEKFDKMTKEEAIEFYESLYDNIKIMFLEICFKLYQKNKSNNFLKHIIQYMNKYIITIPNKDIISKLNNNFKNIFKTSKKLIKPFYEHYKNVLTFYNINIPELKLSDKKIYSITYVSENVFGYTTFHFLDQIGKSKVNYQKIIKADKTMRYFDYNTKIWLDLPVDLKEELITHLNIQKEQETEKRNLTYGYYGTLDKDDKFRIVGLTSKGFICKNINQKSKLIDIFIQLYEKDKTIYNIFEQNNPIYDEWTKDVLLKSLKGNKKLENIKNLNKMNKEELLKIQHMSLLETKQLCSKLHDWFLSKNILYKI